MHDYGLSKALAKGVSRPRARLVAGKADIPAFTRGAVVKTVITPACHAGGRGFESLPLRQQKGTDCSYLRSVFFAPGLRCDHWMLYDNVGQHPVRVAAGENHVRANNAN